MPVFFYYIYRMTRKILICLCALLAIAGCNKNSDPEPGPDPQPVPVPTDGRSDISYQLLVYSFADSNGDGIGDFRGIEQKLDYLKEMGVQALWLSPIHPAASYHGYDVTDYAAVNPEYGTEADFKALVDAAHAKGIKIYLDYVLNHTSKDHPWFKNATSSADNEYRDYYMISSDPKKDVEAGKFPMMSKSSYNSGEWSRVATGITETEKVKFTLTMSSGKPSSLKMDKVEEISNPGSQNTGVWIYYGDGKMEQFYQNSGVYSLSLELSSDWGVLIRTSTSDTWPTGTKYGGKEGEAMLEYGKNVQLYPSSSSFDPADLLLPGMSQEFYLSVFGSYMPDLNYGAASTCENSKAFKAVTAAADKWIALGIDGFRLDAVKHIYHNSKSDENPTFLKKFYNHCNSSYKAAGHSDNFYMVGEHFSEVDEVAPYYAGMPGFFEFAFWWRLSDCLNRGEASSFAAMINGYHDKYARYRNDFVAATKLSNHDEDRAASVLGRDAGKERVAAAVLLTCAGNPYIYQGEELGYWGTKANGDEYVRAPMKWTRDGEVAAASLGGKVDAGMLTPSISVEAQAGDKNSILSAYRSFGKARAAYKALSRGTMRPVAFSNAGLAIWEREYDGQKVLVVHNFTASQISYATQQYSFNNCIASCGTVTARDGKLAVGGLSSAVYLQ